MPEMLQTLKAVQKTEDEKRRFLASLQGVNLDEDSSSESVTFDDVKRRAFGISASKDDVVSLQGEFAKEAGFGIGLGLGYSRE